MRLINFCHGSFGCIHSALLVFCFTLFLAGNSQASRIHLDTFSPKVAKRFISKISSPIKNKILNSKSINSWKSRLEKMRARVMASREFSEKNEKFDSRDFLDDSDTDKSSYQYLSGKSFENPVDIAKKFILNKFPTLKSNELQLTSSYKDTHSSVSHIYFKQVFDGVTVENGDVNVNIDHHGRIISFGESLYIGDKIESLTDHEDDEDDTDAEESVQSTKKSAFSWISDIATRIVDQFSFKLNSDLKSVKKSFKKTIKKMKKKLNALDAVVKVSEFLKLPIPPSEKQAVVDLTNSDGNNFGEALPSKSSKSLVLGFNHTLTNGIPVEKKYLIVSGDNPSSEDDERLIVVWDIQMEMEENWLHAHVGHSDGQVHSLIDWVSDATFDVYPLGVDDPEDGDRKIVRSPEIGSGCEASPFGWTSLVEGDSHGEQLYGKTLIDNYKWTITNTTIGNNVFAQENMDGNTQQDLDKNYRPRAEVLENGSEYPDSNLSFDFEVDFLKTPQENLDAAITHVFYWNNLLHDLLYVYGFTEQCGNFQGNNFGRGGKGGDAVIANAQDGAGYNNANFASPPDGYHGKMRMYLWKVKNSPDGDKDDYCLKDGSLDTQIIIHEYCHGLSTRLVGGPMNSNCLGWGESGGLGEGWSDAISVVLGINETRVNGQGRDSIIEMGSFVVAERSSNEPGLPNRKGIRKFPYSTNMTVNPSTYSFISKPDYRGVHAKGEVWAVMLYDVYWNLVDKYGYSGDWFNVTASDESKELPLPAGNIQTLHLIVESLKYLPCRPSFIDARDGIIQANEVLYGGDGVCDIWKAFAKRGLGSGIQSNDDLSQNSADDFQIPPECV